jgi:hypothetical protein
VRNTDIMHAGSTSHVTIELVSSLRVFTVLPACPGGPGPDGQGSQQCSTCQPRPARSRHSAQQAGHHHSHRGRGRGTSCLGWRGRGSARGKAAGDYGDCGCRADIRSCCCKHARARAGSSSLSGGSRGSCRGWRPFSTCSGSRAGDSRAGDSGPGGQWPVPPLYTRAAGRRVDERGAGAGSEQLHKCFASHSPPPPPPPPPSCKPSGAHSCEGCGL